MADAAVIEQWLHRHPHPGFERVFGGVTADLVARFVDDAATALLGEAPASTFEWHPAQVVTACIAMPNGERFAMKIYPPGFELLDVLVAARSVQTSLAAQLRSVPAPVGLATIGAAVVVVDEFRAGDRRSHSDAGVIDDMAAGFAALAAQMEMIAAPTALNRSRLTGHPRPPANKQPPDDLRAEFDLCLAFLDQHAELPTVAHLDWRIQNLAWSGRDIAAIYDWDSVANSGESRSVGAAAGMCTYDFRDEVPHVPTPTEVAEFIAAYGRERAIDDRVAGAAAGVKMLGYAATEQHLDPTGAHLGERSFRTQLSASLADYSAVFRP